MALINQKIADFSATAFKNGDVIDVNSSDILGKWAIFFFYPADFTFVCPSELIAFDHRLEDFAKRGVEVIGVSIDSQLYLVLLQLCVRINS